MGEEATITTQSHKVFFFAILETQVLDAEHIDVSAFWGSNDA